MSEVIQAKKIAPKLITDAFTGDTPANKFENSKGIFLGRVQKYTVGTSKQNGQQYLKFSGDFEARVNGVITRSHIMYLPEVAEMEIGSAVVNAVKEAGDRFGGVDFGIELYKVFDEKSVTKYQWRFKHLLPPNTAAIDPLALIFERMQLPAGVASAAQLTEKASTTAKK